MTGRSKLYTEDIPKEKRVMVCDDGLYDIGDSKGLRESLLHGICSTAYPRRPLPSTFTFHIGQVNGKIHYIWELVFSNKMRMTAKNGMGGFNRGWWFDNTAETLKEAEEALSCLDEAVAILRG